jgi:ribosomal protein S18 acetylase RimI-like enzyme
MATSGGDVAGAVARIVARTVDSPPMGSIRIVDVTDVAAFDRIPPCADARFDHRSCDYWEDADRGSKAARASWLKPAAESRDKQAATTLGQSSNPFLADLQGRESAFNPFTTERPTNPFLTAGEDDTPSVDNPFAPKPVERERVGTEAPRKLQLLGRGLGIAGSYAKVLLDDDVPAAYAQFGPLTAYPRAQRTRELYPALPDSPLPAVITCIATTAKARGAGLARRLVEAVCEDLATRGFTAVETYPEIGADAETTSAATPEFWESLAFSRAIGDERFPVMRRDLT